MEEDAWKRERRRIDDDLDDGDKRAISNGKKRETENNKFEKNRSKQQQQEQQQQKRKALKRNSIREKSKSKFRLKIVNLKDQIYDQMNELTAQCPMRLYEDL